MLIIIYKQSVRGRRMAWRSRWWRGEGGDGLAASPRAAARRRAGGRLRATTPRTTASGVGAAAGPMKPAHEQVALDDGEPARGVEAGRGRSAPPRRAAGRPARPGAGRRSPPSELPATTTSAPPASALRCATASAAKASSWGSTGPGGSAGQAPNPGRSTARARRPVRGRGGRTSAPARCRPSRRSREGGARAQAVALELQRPGSGCPAGSSRRA